MSREDFIYLFLLLLLTYFGKYYRSNGCVRSRKELGTVIGLFTVFLISGFHMLHCIISFFLCATVITKSHPSKCHTQSFAVMFGYLFFLRTSNYLFGLPNIPEYTNMVQMMLTLKLVGVAFEKNTAYEKIQRKLNTKIAFAYRNEEVSDFELQLQVIQMRELFHYSFNYIGVMAGPYYRYRTFYDYFETPFKDNIDCSRETIGKLKCISLYIVVYVSFGAIWPISYATTEEFYENHSWIYRLFYIWPAFVIFRSRIYIGFTLGEIVCTNAGFGVYPEAADVANGEGPKKPYLEYKENPKTKYNFKTIENMNVYNMETCTSFKASLKEWNMCIQYWLALNVYKRFPSKQFRTTATLLVSSFWHGLQPGYYMCIMGAVFYIPLEEMINKLLSFEPNDQRRKIADAMFYVSKWFALGYLGMAFYILDFDQIWRYYTSVYHFGYAFYVIVFIGAMVFRDLKEYKKRID